MNNKTWSLLLVLGALLLAGFFSWQKKVTHEGQVRLAKEMSRLSTTMMQDLHGAQVETVTGVPVDGKWHGEIAFKNMHDESVEYKAMWGELKRFHNGSPEVIARHLKSLKMRRVNDDPNILQVQIKLWDAVALNSNFNIRMQEQFVEK